MILRDGSTTNDPRLDRLILFDEKSRDYPIRTLVEGKPLRSYTWRVEAWLDQGREGACVGFGAAHELCSRPLPQKVDEAYARMLYHEAQRVDPWPGGSYPGASPQYEGTAVLAVMKVGQALGHWGEYRWGFSVQDDLLTFGHHGPGLGGFSWYTGMFRPDSDGRIRPTGVVEGGHGLLTGWRIAIPTRRRAQGEVWLWQSWGREHGKDGAVYMTFDDYERVRYEQGEVAFPVGRRLVA